MAQMIIGVLKLTFELHGNDSLKGKRRVSSSLKQKLRNKFNVAVAETEAQDSQTTLVLSVVTVSGDSTRLQSQLDKILSMVEAASDEDLVDTEMETIVV